MPKYIEWSIGLMKRSHFTSEQIVFAPRQAESGTPVAEFVYLVFQLGLLICKMPTLLADATDFFTCLLYGIIRQIKIQSSLERVLMTFPLD
jgi:hypothetical protein